MLDRDPARASSPSTGSIARRALAVAALLVACGGEGDPATSSLPPDTGRAPGGDPSTAPSPATPSPLFDGVWTVTGRDARGAYVGVVEIRSSAATDPAAPIAFTRSVRYPDVVVEDGRALHWLFQGTLAREGGALTLRASLEPRDFIVSRGGVTRTVNDAPLALTGTLRASGAAFEGTLAGPGIALTERWSDPVPLGPTPLHVDRRDVTPAHDPPSASEKRAAFALYASYHALAVIQPYVARPAFDAAIHGAISDATDLDFYRANPDALRVVQKPIDPVSLGESRARADAYRYSLAAKAARFDQDMEQRFVDPDVGMIPNGGKAGGGYADQEPSVDSALWTGIYVASQVYRFEVTGAPQARANARRSLSALLSLQEITGDWTRFARSLRKATGAPQPPWHAGTGPYAGLEWLEGGNNDMAKGLFYAYLVGWEAFCEGGKTGEEALCARLRVNAKHIADDLKLAGGNAAVTQVSNQLPMAWLAAVITDDLGDALTYRSKAEGYWTADKALYLSTVPTVIEGQLDGSGAHLGSLAALVRGFLAKRMDLGGDAVAKTQAFVDQGYDNVQRFRHPEWDVLAATMGGGAADPGRVAVMRARASLRLAEVPYPKVGYAIDRRVSPRFCMSPYPSLPWKGDWMQYPAHDRTAALDTAPYFEGPMDVLLWKTNNRYLGSADGEAPAPDYLHVYWYARKTGLFTDLD